MKHLKRVLLESPVDEEGGVDVREVCDLDEG
jgi:hypothetical protein